MSARFILISGCSGGGKSTLLAALARRGFATVPEPGRRIVAEELDGAGAALPWVDLRAFARRAISLSRADLARAADLVGPVFVDRGLVDAAVALAFAGGAPYPDLLGPDRHYARRVFLAPPWPEIFVTDAERKHGMAEAEAEYARLVAAFGALGYDACELPKVPVPDRVQFVVGALGLS